MVAFFVKGQSIEVPEETVAIAKTYRYLKAQFIFITNDWKGHTVTAFFARENLNYAYKLDENNTVDISGLPAGEWEVSLMGTKDENGTLAQRITTETVLFPIEPFKVDKVDRPPASQPTEFEKLQNSIGDMSKLKTEDKSSLVNAVNEIHGQISLGGGGGEISLEVLEQIEANTENRHWHDNKDVLDKFGVNKANTRPTFGGEGNVLATQADVTDRLSPFALSINVPNHASVNGSTLKMQRKTGDKLTDLFSVALPTGSGGGGSGADGFSPIVDVEEITGGHRVTITDIDGTESFDILNGVDGKDGTDGYTPIKGVDYFDGDKGDKGDKGDPFTYDDFTPEQLEALKGKDGNDYVLTDTDKTEIANAVVALLPKYNGEVVEV